MDAVLYTAACDIGNDDDNSPRLYETLRNADIVFVESFKQGSRFLKKAGAGGKEMLELSEHTTEEEIDEYALKLIGKTSVIISDTGAALMEDPGRRLVKKAYEYKAKVAAVPGASSISSALMVCPFDCSRYFYAGLLPRKEVERRRELKKLSAQPHPVILLDTPYRFNALLADIRNSYPAERKMLISFDISTANEENIVSTIEELYQSYKSKTIKKRLYVMVIDGSAYRARKERRGRR